MTVLQSPALTLEDFLRLPETKPPREYINGEIIQKPMPKARHSRLQSKLLSAINGVAENSRIAYAFAELRCTFGGRSLIPDIAVLPWDSIPLNSEGEPLDDVVRAPHWAIEILSPDQSANRVTGNILHCLQYGGQLGWLIDPDDRSIIVFQRERQPQFCHRTDPLPVLDGIELALTAEEVFHWLKMTPE